METPEIRPRWYEGLTAAHWTILAIASAGWIFDVYEGQLFATLAKPMFEQMTGGEAEVEWLKNVGFAVFLLGGAAGGLFFGILGDRHGRLRVMSVTILVYSVFSALTAFTTAPWQVLVLRFLVAMGTGGEWAVAAALVSETFPIRSRAVAGGIFHGSSVAGASLASITGLILTHWHLSWKTGFLIGLLPALLVLWIRLGVRGTPSEAAAESPADLPRPSGNLKELFGDPLWRRRALLGLGLATVGLATYWGTFASGLKLAGDSFVEGSNADRANASNLAYLLMNVGGGLAGLLAFAPLANRLGRRGAFALYHLGAAVLVPWAYLGGYGYATTLVLLSIMAFFVLGMHAGYAIYFPELFPTRLRATGSSACFNLGRVMGSLLLLVRGYMDTTWGTPIAASVISSLFWFGLILLYFAPETRGQKLPD